MLSSFFLPAVRAGITPESDDIFLTEIMLSRNGEKMQPEEKLKARENFSKKKREKREN